MAWFGKLVGLIYICANFIALRFEGLGRVIFLSRASLIVIVATSTLLILMPQGHEIGFTVADRPFWYFLPVIFCSIICWLWVRVILNQEFGRLLDSDKGAKNLGDVPLSKTKIWVTWVPRVVGTLPSVGAALAVFYANSLSGWQAPGTSYLVFAICVVLVVFAFVWFRRRIVGWICTKLGMEDAGHRRFENLVTPRSTVSGDFAGMSDMMKLSLVAGWIVPLGYLIPGLLGPAHIGLLIGASAAVFIPATFLVSLLSTFVFAFNGSRRNESSKEGEQKRYHFPVVSVAVIMSLLIPFFLDGDRFEIRKIAAETEVEPRPNLNAAITAWMKANVDPDNPDKKADMIIVATAGGALRAALWTGTILGRLQDRVPNFENKLFAISGVSGGSLGATSYMSAIWEKTNGIPPKCDQMGRCIEARIQHSLSGDFLGPVMLGLVSNDISLIGLGVVSKDRAEALEEAWEQAWIDSQPAETNVNAGSPNPMKENFLGLWSNPKNRPWPALFLNGTHQQLGSRIITSNIDSAGTFTEGYDFFQLRPQQIAASTAVHNSARFTYISPAGEIDSDNHVIDGGYFENYGAETALEIVKAVRLLDNGNRIRVRIVQIVSDPSSDRGFLDTPSTRLSGTEPRKPKSMVLGQYSAPLQGLLKTREARGLHAAKRLKAEMGTDAENDGTYFLFNMGDDRESSNPVLSWFMPEFVRSKIIKIFSDGQSKNKTVMERLIACLNAADSENREKCKFDAAS